MRDLCDQDLFLLHVGCGIFLCGLLVLMAGCAGGIYRSETRLDCHGLPARMELASVPFHPQREYQCGPAALASALEFSGCKVSPKKISSEIYTPSLEGSLQPLLLSAVRSRSRLPYIIDTFEALIREIAAGHPVVVLQNLSLGFYPIWHYAVVIGYDLDRKIIILRSGEDSRMERGWRTVEKTWGRAENWGFVVLRLDELPASADEPSYMGEKPFLTVVDAFSP
ncbi:PA2778 family cysteine peptidase [Desulfatiglans anilini]|uniref:PA2778 family cysteine peptidase n=1 Tax=Desulfatiglans anilini TaxID=90728 RepID=UPI0006885A74|nr:PA2778 family cysteine peptidase [Desulfatiglans anilini]